MARGADLATPAAQRERVTLPADWQSLFGDNWGPRTFFRRFHSPTGLVTGDRVHLILTGVTGTGTVAIDGQPLGEIDPGGDLMPNWDVTELFLSPSRPGSLPASPLAGHELAITLEIPESMQGEEYRLGLFGPVVLAIHSSQAGAASQ
jgi:hypothetical protein